MYFDWDALGFKLGFLLAGLCGAFVLKPKGNFTWWEFGSRLISGALCANYITPIVLVVIPTLSNFGMGVAFIVGYGGIHIADAIVDFIKNKFTNNGSEK